MDKTQTTSAAAEHLIEKFCAAIHDTKEQVYRKNLWPIAHNALTCARQEGRHDFHWQEDKLVSHLYLRKIYVGAVHSMSPYADTYRVLLMTDDDGSSVTDKAVSREEGKEILMKAAWEALA